jgi:hypothetical protein
MDIGARFRVGRFFNAFNVCLNSCRLLRLCLACCISCLMLVLVCGDSFSVDWAQLNRILPQDGDRNQSTKCCVLNRNRMVGNVQKHNNFRNRIYHSNFILLNTRDIEAYF